MKVVFVNVRLVTLSVLVAVVARFDLANCIPVGDSELGTETWPSSVSSGSQTSAAPPPLVFPSGNTGVYKIVENDTALKILQARAAAELSETSSTGETTEGQNVQQQSLSTAESNVINNGNNPAAGNLSSVAPPASPNEDDGDDDDEDDGDDDDDDDDDGDDDDYSSEEDADQNDQNGSINTEVINVQPEDPNKEDGLEEQFGNKDNHYPMVIDDEVIEVSIRQEHLWVIVAGAIFVLTLTAYMAMILYRNRLERRYGMRQRLVTEDDFYTNNDI
ncbi:uncharacterized protein LOC131425592 [Malaya genurostris]|uniref:uncharacterized protein LOC131425592 n=1 Tax=Malaya genurostris TaxID=325434 RepID=UPI0026F3C8BD|nr:uncharacterized protein LOC131425592 [Malaya genurostris]